MKLLLENWKRYINENENTNNIWYHTTTRENLQSILKNGLKINSAANYSIGSLDYMKHVYGGKVPIFVAKSPEPYDNDLDGIVLEIDITGLELVSDIPTLLSHYGAYLDENGIWFKDDHPKAPLWTKGEDLIFFRDLLNPNSVYCSDSIATTGTAAIMQDIPPQRIKVIGNV